MLILEYVNRLGPNFQLELPRDKESPMKMGRGFKSPLPLNPGPAQALHLLAYFVVSIFFIPLSAPTFSLAHHFKSHAQHIINQQRENKSRSRANSALGKAGHVSARSPSCRVIDINSNLLSSYHSVHAHSAGKHNIATTHLRHLAFQYFPHSSMIRLLCILSCRHYGHSGLNSHLA